MPAGQQLNTYETSNTIPNFLYEKTGIDICQQNGCCNIIAQYIPNRDNGDIWFVNPLGELFVLPDGYAHTIYIETIPSLVNWKLTQFTLKNINCYAGANDEIIRPPYYQNFIGFQTDISHAIVFYKKPLKKITRDAYVKIYDGLFMHVADYWYSAENMSCGTRSEWDQYRDCNMKECSVAGKDEKQVFEDIWAYRKSMQCIRTPDEVSLGDYTCNRAFQDNDVRNNIIAGVENCKKAVRECYEIKAEADNPVKPRTPPCDSCGDPHINTNGIITERIYGKPSDYNCNEGMEDPMYGLRVICEGFPGINDGISYTYPGVGTFDNGYFATGYQNDYLALCAYAYRAHTSAASQYDIRGTLNSPNDLPLYRYTTDGEGYVLDENGERLLDNNKPVTKEDLCKKDRQIEMDAAPDGQQDTVKNSRCVFSGDAFMIQSDLWVYVGDRWVNKGLNFGYEFWKIFYKDDSATPLQKGDEQCRPLYKPLWQGRVAGGGNIIECGNHVWVDGYDKALIHDGKVAYDIKYEEYYKWTNLNDTNNRLFCQNQVAYIRIRIEENQYRTIMYAQFADDNEFTKIFDTTQPLAQSLDLRGMHQDYLLFKHIDKDDLILYCRTQKIYEDEEYLFLGNVGTTSYPAPHYYAVVGTIGDNGQLNGKVWKDCNEIGGTIALCPYAGNNSFGDPWDWCFLDDEINKDSMSTQACRYPGTGVAGPEAAVNDGMYINSLGGQPNGTSQEAFATSQWSCDESCCDSDGDNSVTLIKTGGAGGGCDSYNVGVTYKVRQGLLSGMPTYQIETCGTVKTSEMTSSGSTAQGAALICSWAGENCNSNPHWGLDCNTGFSVSASVHSASTGNSGFSGGSCGMIASTVHYFEYKKGNATIADVYVGVVPFDWFKTLTVTNCEIPSSTMITSYVMCSNQQGEICNGVGYSRIMTTLDTGASTVMAYGGTTTVCVNEGYGGAVQYVRFPMSPPMFRSVHDSASPISNDTHTVTVFYPNYRFSVNVEVQKKTYAFTYTSAFSDVSRSCKQNPNYNPTNNYCLRDGCTGGGFSCNGWCSIQAPYSCHNIEQLTPNDWNINNPSYRVISTDWGDKHYLALLVPERLYNFSTLIGGIDDGDRYSIDTTPCGSLYAVSHNQEHQGSIVQGYLFYKIHVLEITENGASEVLTISDILLRDVPEEFGFVGTYGVDPGLWISWAEYKAYEYTCTCRLIKQPCRVALITGDSSPRPEYTDINGVHHCEFGADHCGIAAVYTQFGTELHTSRLEPAGKNYSVKEKPSLTCCGWYYAIHYLPSNNTSITGEVFWRNYSLHAGTTYSLSCCNEWFSYISYNGQKHFFAGKTEVYSHSEDGDPQYDEVSWICCGHVGVLRMLKHKQGQFDHCGNSFLQQFQILNGEVTMVLEMLAKGQYSSIASSISPIPELQPGQKFEEIGTYIDVYQDKNTGQYFGIINNKKDICNQPVPAGIDYTQSHGKVYLVNDTGVAKLLYDDSRIDNIECCNPPYYDEKGDYVKPNIIWATFLIDPNIYKHVEMYVEEERGGEGSSLKETGTQELTYPNPYPRLPDEYKKPQQMTPAQLQHRFPGRGVYIWNQGGDRLSNHHGKTDTLPCWFDDTGFESHRGKFMYWGDLFAAPRYDFQWTHTYGTEPRWKGTVPFTCANNRLIFNANGVYHIFDLEYGRLDLSTVTLKIPISKQE
jgi:hypothetical protein